MIPLTTESHPPQSPPGWQWELLTDLARLESGHTPSRRHPEWWDGDIPWLALPDIRAVDCAVIHDTTEMVNAAGIANSSARILPEDTVALSRTASVGFVTVLGRPMATSQDFVCWVCGPQLRPRFLMHLLHTARDCIRGLASGAIHKTVYVPTVKAFRVCIPSLREQDRVVAELDQQLDATARLRAAADQQAARVRELTGIVVNREFEALADDWPLRAIGEMARVLSGYAFKSAWFSDQGVRLIRNANVSQGSIDWMDTVRLPEDMRSDFAEYELSAGDIVLALDRPMVAAGLKVARLARGDVPSLLLQRVATFRLSDDLDAGYLYAFLRTRAFAAAISGHEQSLGVPHVSPKQVAAVVVPVPPIARQRDIVRSLDDELRSVAHVAAAVRNQAAETRRLPAALLRRAFSGGL